MSWDLVILAERNLPLVYGLAAGTLFGMGVEWLAARGRRRRWRERPRFPPLVHLVAPRIVRHPVPPRVLEATEQLRIVMGARFAVRPLLNRHEARVFRELDRMVVASNPGWQVMAQVSLGEILSSEDSAAYGCINAKRVDLLLVDADCRPRHAIEYQGAGHHQGSAAARDAVKKEALRRAGVGYHEVVAGHTTPADLKRLVEKLVEKSAAA